MMGNDLGRELRAADERFGEVGLPARVDARLRRRLFGGERAPSRLRWGPIFATTAALAGAAAALVVGILPAPRAAWEGTVASLDVIERPADVRIESDASGVASVHGPVTLAGPRWGAALQTFGETKIRREARGVRLEAGRVRVAARRRDRAAGPTRVLVSHGEIEVLGTLFEVVQESAGGEVRLFEGSIRFLAQDGRAVMLAPGQALRWPLPPPSASSAAPSPAAPSPAASSLHAPAAFAVVAPISEPPVDGDAEEVAATTEPAAAALEEVAALDEPASPVDGPRPIDEVLDEVESLRAARRYGNAAQVLRSALASRYRAATLERISYELGALLGSQLHAGKDACAHWRAHLRRFPQGYAEEIEAAMARLHCGASE